jgi:hypothetical protein
MDASKQKSYGHSAEVHIHLYLNGRVLAIGQLGPNFLMLDNPIDHPPADAEIFLSIDGHEKRWRIRLIDGISSTKPKTRISRPAQTNGSTVG